MGQKNQSTPMSPFEIEQAKKSLVRDPREELPPDDKIKEFLETVDLPADPDPEED